MKISHNWLKTYLDFDLTSEELEYWLTTLGLEVEGIEDFESIKGGLKGIVTGEVLTCQQHPNADRLSITTVDIADGAPLHVVCGAPNVAAGQKVLVATVGTELFSPEGEAWTIRKSKIRGELSEGMICAEDELGLGQSHEGIVVLPDATKIGIPATQLFHVEKDFVYEIGLTPNRSDGTSHLGVARDLAAGLGYKAGKKLELTYPEIKKETDGKLVDFSVVVKNAEACPRYSGLILEDIKIGESPSWLQNRLNSIGVRPINNVVDITNYVLHEYGQPLHAFDLDKVNGAGIIVDTLPQDTIFVSLDEVERKLDDQDLMICDAHEQPMCIGGVFGGIHSGVSETTTRIFLESAHFNAESIRKSSMRHGLRTDAAKVFEKGSDPNITDEAVWRAANMMKELCGASVAEPVFDIYPNPILKKSVRLRRERANTLIGVDFSHEDLRQLFDHLNMEIENETDDYFDVLIPTDKSDVVREVDVIEELLRVYGYDQVAVSSKLKTSIVHSEGDAIHELRKRLVDRFTARGFHQMMNLSLSKSAYYSKRSDLVPVLNTSNSHLDIMRPDLIHSALEAVSQNTKHQNRDLILFEFGHAYTKQDDGFNEKEILSFVVTGQQTDEHWKKKPLPADYYHAKSILEQGLPVNVVKGISYKDEPIAYADYGQVVLKGKRQLGFICKVDDELCRRFDLDQPIYYAQLNFGACYEIWSQHQVTYQTVSKFPGTQRDMALIVEDSISYNDIQTVIKNANNKKIKHFSLFDIYENEEHIGKGKKSMGVRIDFLDDQKTLQDKEVDKMVSKLMTAFQRNLGAELR